MSQTPSWINHAWNKGIFVAEETVITLPYLRSKCKWQGPLLSCLLCLDVEASRSVQEAKLKSFLAMLVFQKGSMGLEVKLISAVFLCHHVLYYPQFRSMAKIIIFPCVLVFQNGLISPVVKLVSCQSFVESCSFFILSSVQEAKLLSPSVVSFSEQFDQSSS